MTHTPGPWKTVRPGHGHKTPYLCVQIGEDDTYTTLELRPEDARLIAAAPELRQTTGELHRLLREWRRTPFFEDTSEWQRWVDDFGVRVDQATDMAVTVLRKVTEVQP